MSERSSRLAELESFLGTVPGMIYRTTRLVPPYDVEFLERRGRDGRGLSG